MSVLLHAIKSVIYLYVEGVVTLPVKVTLPEPEWAESEGDKCSIYKTPPISPSWAL